MANKKIDPKRVAYKNSFEWQGVIMPNGKTAAEVYGANNKTPKKTPQKKK